MRSKLDISAAIIRPLAIADMDTIMDVEAKAHSHPWRRKSMQDSLTGRHHCMGIWLQERLLGFYIASAAAGDAELLNIAVDPACQRQGVAATLMQDLVTWASAIAQTVFLEVRMSNRRAIDLYQQFDFFEVGERPNYYPTAKGREGALIMARYQVEN